MRVLFPRCGRAKNCSLKCSLSAEAVGVAIGRPPVQPVILQMLPVKMNNRILHFLQHFRPVGAVLFLFRQEKYPKEADLRGASCKGAPLRIPRRIAGTLVQCCRFLFAFQTTIYRFLPTKRAQQRLRSYFILTVRCGSTRTRLPESARRPKAAWDRGSPRRGTWQ